MISPYSDINGNKVEYGQLIDFTWFYYIGTEVELHYKAKIRHRKNGDIVEFYPRNGKMFTHRLSALEWSEDNLCVDLQEDRFYK